MISGRKGGYEPVDTGGLHHESTPTTTFCALASRSRNQARTVPTRQAVTPAPSFTGEGNLASFTIRHKVVPEKGSTLPRSCAWRTKALSGSLSNWCMLAGSTGCNDLHFANHTEVSHRQKRSTVFLTGGRVCSRLGLLRAVTGLSRRRIQWGTYELSKLLTQFFN